jgi:sRNA-binding protein
VVYRVNFGSRMQRFGMSAPALPPLARVEFIEVDQLAPQIEKVLDIEGDEKRRIEVIIDSQEIHIDGDEIHFEQGVTFSDELRQAVNDMRAAAQDMRDAKRVIRDLSRVDKQANDSARKLSEQQLAQAQEKLEQAQQQMELARAELRRSQGQIQQRTSARMEQMQQARAARIAAFEQTFVQTLCDYGNTLRDLPNNERISLVVVGAGDNDTDKIHVFNKNDVINCKGEKGASDLLAKAITYSF